MSLAHPISLCMLTPLNNIMQIIIIKIIFRIVKKLDDEKEKLIMDLEEELETNCKNIDKQKNQPVQYGEKILLQHYSSKKFLSVQ